MASEAKLIRDYDKTPLSRNCKDIVCVSPVIGQGARPLELYFRQGIYELPGLVCRCHVNNITFIKRKRLKFRSLIVRPRRLRTKSSPSHLQHFSDQ